MGRKPYRKLKITYEILPPGTLKREPSDSCPTDPVQRWKEIQDICADIIRRNTQQE